MTYVVAGPETGSSKSSASETASTPSLPVAPRKKRNKHSFFTRFILMHTHGVKDFGSYGSAPLSALLDKIISS